MGRVVITVTALFEPAKQLPAICRKNKKIIK
jgi:hypothetical protein